MSEPWTGDMVAALRKKYFLTHEALASILNVEPKTVRGWENGRTPSGASVRLLELVAGAPQVFNDPRLTTAAATYGFAPILYHREADPDDRIFTVAIAKSFDDPVVVVDVHENLSPDENIELTKALMKAQEHISMLVSEGWVIPTWGADAGDAAAR